MTRFSDFRWLATTEVGRALRRRLNLEPDDANQAALIGLHQADVAADSSLTSGEFEAYARIRIRGAIVDELRRTQHGSRRGGKASSLKPWRADPVAAQLAQEDGLLPLTVIMGEEIVAVGRSLTPEQQAIESEEWVQWRANLKTWLAVLPKRDAQIVRMLLVGQRQRAIARHFGISEPRVSQLLRRSLEAMAGKRASGTR